MTQTNRISPALAAMLAAGKRSERHDAIVV